MSDILKIGSTIHIELLFDDTEWGQLPDSFNSLIATAVYEDGSEYTGIVTVNAVDQMIIVEMDSETMPAGLYNLDVKISNAGGIVVFVPESRNIQFILAEGIN